MHPDIRKFWEEIGEVDLTPSAPIIYYVVEPKGLKYHYITIAEVWNGGINDGPKQPTKYFLYGNEEYTEAEMLKIIKMKPFI